MKKNLMILVIVVALIITTVLVCIGGNGDNQNNNTQNNQQDHSHDHSHDHGNADDGSSHGEKRTIKLAMSYGEDSVHYLAAKEFANQVAAKSDGNIIVEIYANGKLGMDATLINALAEHKNVVDILITEVDNFSKYDKKMEISSLPFLFQSHEDAMHFMNGSVQEEIEQGLIGKNMRVLSYYSNGFDCITTTKKSIHAVGDVRGITFATSSKDYSAIVLRTVEADVFEIQQNSVMQILRQGNCQGYLGSLQDVYLSNLFREQENLAVTYHSYNALAFVISEDVWNSFDKECQDIICEAAEQSGYMDCDLMRQEESKMLKEMEALGVKISYPSLSGFRQKAESVIRSLTSVYGTIIEEVLGYVKVE